MSDNATTGCSCELCRPNYYMGWDGGFVPEPEEAPALKQKQDKDETPAVRPEKVPLIPAMAN